MSRDSALLLDMVIAARKIQQFSQGLTREGFQSDDTHQFAIMHAIQIIGEAARCVSPEYKQQHPEVPWRRIVGMRHHLVHEYFDIDVEEVWKVVETDIPALLPVIESLVPPDSEAPP
jgi:uncharacterized protein with HEPN domain